MNFNDVCNFFYFIAGKQSLLPTNSLKMININLNEFEFTPEHMFALSYLDALDRDLLITSNDKNQWNYVDHPFSISNNRALQLVRKYSSRSNDKYKEDQKDHQDEMFSVIKVNKFGSHQSRVLNITQNGIENIKDNKVTSFELWENIKTSYLENRKTIIIECNDAKRTYQSNETNISKIHKLIQTQLNSSITMIYLRSFLNFLYQQFIRLAGSTILISPDMAVDVAGKYRKKKFVQYHKSFASSIARIAKNFACVEYMDSNFNRRNDNDQDEKYNTIKINRQFHLIKAWKNADPPIALLNAPYLTHITAPNLLPDLSFQTQNSSNSYTLLCNNLDKCKHSEAEEWKLVQKIMQ
eukprot:500820_1